jgi:hypothetical protein
MEPNLYNNIFYEDILFINDKNVNLGKVSEQNQYTLQAGTHLFRSGPKDEVEYKKPTSHWFPIVDKGKRPVFFSNQYVAATYATDKSYLYRYKIVNDVVLRVVNKNLIDDIKKLVTVITTQINEGKSRPLGEEYTYEEKKQTCMIFLILFGKDMIFNNNVTDKQIDYQRKEILKDYPAISVLPLNKDTFNRISTTNYDIEYFGKMLELINKHSNIKYDGFYCPSFDAGQFNKTHILGSDTLFPQEIFLPSFISLTGKEIYSVESFYSDKKSHPGYKYVPLNKEGTNLDIDEQNIRMLRCFQRTDMTNPEVYGNMEDNLEVDEFPKSTTPSLVKYIASLQLQYEEIANNFLSYIDKSFKIEPTPGVDEDFQDPADMASQKYILDTVKPRLEKAILSTDFQIVLFAELLELVQKGLSMDVTLFQNMPLKQANPNLSGPFHDGAEFNENLFLYSVLNNMLKQNVVGLNKLFEQSLSSMYVPLGLNTRDTFKAVISGGALFGIYTYGDFRRQTKDIDLKIILESDNEPEPRDQSLYIYTTPNRKMYFEILHLIPTMITSVWGILSTEIFRNLAGYKIDFFKQYLLEHPYHLQLPNKHKNVAGEAYSFYLGVKPTVQKPNPEMLIFDYIKFVTNEDVASAWIILFDGALKTTKKSNGTQTFPEGYKSFYNYRKSLFEQRKAAKISKNNAKKSEINEQLKNLKKYIVGVFLSKVCQDFFIANKIPINDETALNIIIDSVPSFVQNVRLNVTLPTGGNPYFKAGDFASLDIVVNNDKKNRDYGLIDYTYDSRYLTIGSFQKSSGLIHNGYDDINEIPYASAYHFIYESNKLNTICKRGYPFEAMFVEENNPFNACAPNPENRAKKAAKYANRYQRVLDYMSQVLGSKYDSLDKVLSMVTKLQEHSNFNEKLINYAQSRRGAEYFIGAGRKRKQTRRRKSKHMKKSKKTRGNRK